MDEQKFAELIDDAAKLWLEACSQRYRFRVKIPQGAEDIMNRKVDDVSPMILVAKPSLVRCGNSQGQDLMTEEFLSDWAGEVIEYEYVEPIV
jgi:hypothetical protein